MWSRKPFWLVLVYCSPAERWFAVSLREPFLLPLHALISEDYLNKYNCQPRSVSPWWKFQVPTLLDDKIFFVVVAEQAVECKPKCSTRLHRGASLARQDDCVASSWWSLHSKQGVSHGDLDCSKQSLAHGPPLCVVGVIFPSCVSVPCAATDLSDDVKWSVARVLLLSRRLCAVPSDSIDPHLWFLGHDLLAALHKCYVERYRNLHPKIFDFAP
jgi:hypothetical protein